jgi:2-oxo-3-hexenedioate decarboxylase
MNVQDIARQVFAVLETGRQIAPFSKGNPDLNLDQAYQITAAVRALREARGERAIGRKIGLTNRTIWAEYGVYAPIWGYVYDRTVNDLTSEPLEAPLKGLAEPRIEPEVMFGLGVPPEPGMNEQEFIGCINWIAHGFEIVQSIFPSWAFRAPDTVAAYGLHGRLFVGPRHQAEPRRDAWALELSRFASSSAMQPLSTTGLRQMSSTGHSLRCAISLRRWRKIPTTRRSPRAKS